MGPYWRDSLSMSLAVGVIGVTFGVCADAAGFSLPRIMAMSVFVFAGQFAVVGVIDSGGAAAAAVGAALLLASRNALYGPVVRQFLPLSLLGRITGAHFVSDQSTAIAVAQTDRRDASAAFWFTGVTLWLCWNVGSVVGATLGPVMGTPDRWGLDAALPATFVALVAGQLHTAASRTAALGAAVVALGAVPVTSPGIPIVLSVVALAPAAWVQAHWKQPPSVDTDADAKSGASL